jgi:hypothetical protein
MAESTFGAGSKDSAEMLAVEDFIVLADAYEAFTHTE